MAYVMGDEAWLKMTRFIPIRIDCACAYAAKLAVNRAIAHAPGTGAGASAPRPGPMVGAITMQHRIFERRGCDSRSGERPPAQVRYHQATRKHARSVCTATIRIPDPLTSRDADHGVDGPYPAPLSKPQLAVTTRLWLLQGQSST